MVTLEESFLSHEIKPYKTVSGSFYNLNTVPDLIAAVGKNDESIRKSLRHEGESYAFFEAAYRIYQTAEKLEQQWRANDMTGMFTPDECYSREDVALIKPIVDVYSILKNLNITASETESGLKRHVYMTWLGGATCVGGFGVAVVEGFAGNVPSTIGNVVASLAGFELFRSGRREKYRLDGNSTGEITDHALELYTRAANVNKILLAAQERGYLNSCKRRSISTSV